MQFIISTYVLLPFPLTCSNIATSLAAPSVQDQSDDNLRARKAAYRPAYDVDVTTMGAPAAASYFAAIPSPLPAVATPPPQQPAPPTGQDDTVPQYADFDPVHGAIDSNWIGGK